MNLLSNAVVGSSSKSSSKVVKKFVVKTELMCFVFDNLEDFSRFQCNNNEFRYSVEYLDNYNGVNDVLLFDYLNGNKEYYSKIDDKIIKCTRDNLWIICNNPFFIDYEYNLFNQESTQLSIKKLKRL